MYYKIVRRENQKTITRKGERGKHGRNEHKRDELENIEPIYTAYRF